MGASLDYRRERFTMDDDYVRAVMRFFVHLYRKGWIYRANRIINWCPFHETSLSDLELVHVERDDALVVRSATRSRTVTGGITIATARPATIPADVAVAVHPDDERYRDARRPGGRSCRSSSGACRSSPTNACRPSSAPARSRSRRGTIRSTSRSGAPTSSPSRWWSGPTGE